MSTRKIAEVGFNPFQTEESIKVIPTNLEELERMVSGEAGLDVEIHAYANGRFEVGPEGVRYVSGNGTLTRICGDLRIEARTRDAQSKAWGLLLRWWDEDGREHTWAMPEELLHGELSEVLKELSSQGLRISPGAGSRLREYLQVWPVRERVRCVEQLGWHGGVYCTPDVTIGNARGERVVFQSSSPLTADYGRSGTAEQWCAGLASLARGNSRLLFAVSCAFAGPLLNLVCAESGGFHFVGQSSSGKTTALRAAASVWGNPEKFIRQWRSTANGMEGLASLHNDSLLILDEIQQFDPRQAGEVAYLLANGKGKARASRTGAARESASWRLLFLSSGEVSLGTMVESTGKKANAGQELRLANINADAGAGLGMFEALHGKESPAAFANALKDACGAAYGAVGREWLIKLVNDRDRSAKFIAVGILNFVAAVSPDPASGQVRRVAQRFGIVAVAGELATVFGLTGWEEGEAAAGVRECFNDWLSGYGKGNREDSIIEAQVRLFIEKHGSSRFQRWDVESPEKIINQAGFWKDDAGKRQFLVTPEVFRSEVVMGFNPTTAARVLKEKAMLITDGGRNDRSVRIPAAGSGSKKVYCIVVPEEVTA